jgi:hypothetical protein
MSGFSILFFIAVPHQTPTAAMSIASVKPHLTELITPIGWVFFYLGFFENLGLTGNAKMLDFYLDFGRNFCVS